MATASATARSQHDLAGESGSPLNWGLAFTWERTGSRTGAGSAPSQFRCAPGSACACFRAESHSPAPQNPPRLPESRTLVGSPRRPKPVSLNHQPSWKISSSDARFTPLKDQAHLKLLAATAASLHPVPPIRHAQDLEPFDAAWWLCLPKSTRACAGCCGALNWDGKKAGTTARRTLVDYQSIFLNEVATSDDIANRLASRRVSCRFRVKRIENRLGEDLEWFARLNRWPASGAQSMPCAREANGGEKCRWRRIRQPGNLGGSAPCTSPGDPRPPAMTAPASGAHPGEAVKTGQRRHHRRRTDCSVRGHNVPFEVLPLL